MIPDPDYPRMLFHPAKDWVIVKSAEEEAALGAEWSRTVVPKSPAPEAAKPTPKLAEPRSPGRGPGGRFSHKQPR